MRIANREGEASAAGEGSIPGASSSGEGSGGGLGYTCDLLSRFVFIFFFFLPSGGSSIAFSNGANIFDKEVAIGGVSFAASAHVSFTAFVFGRVE